MGLLIAAGALILGFGTAYVVSPDVRYVSRAGFEEMRILGNRVPMLHVAADSAATPELRDQARLVLDVRAFAKHLGLDAGDTYTMYSDVGRDTLLLVLTASPRTCLCPVTWRYPFVGRVPYKGFFKPEQAQKAAQRYAARGDDVNLRPSSAFSTLGWFNDPLLSTALTSDSVELAALVFHEIAHNTIWVKGATAFNESFAQWVGYRAAQEFFRSLGDSTLADRAGARWHDEQILGGYYHRLIERLDSLYALHEPAAANHSGRATIAQWAHDTLTNVIGPILQTYRVGNGPVRPINNAALIGVTLYRSHLDLFDDWDRSNGRDLTRGVYQLKQLLDGAGGGEEAFRRMQIAMGRSAEADSRTESR